VCGLCIQKTGEEAWWAHDEHGEPLFPELMAEFDAIKSRTLSGLMIRRDRKDRKAAYRCRGSRPMADSTI
jgi:hypothetical protein